MKMESLKLILFFIFVIISFGTTCKTNINVAVNKKSHSHTTTTTEAPPPAGKPTTTTGNYRVLEELQEKGRRKYNLGCISNYCFGVVCNKDGECTHLSFIVQTPYTTEVFYLEIAEHYSGVESQELEGPEDIMMGCVGHFCFGAVCDEERNCTHWALGTRYLQNVELFYLEVLKEFSLEEGQTLYNLGCASLYCFGAICDDKEEYCEYLKFTALAESKEFYLEIADHVSYRRKL